MIKNSHIMFKKGTLWQNLVKTTDNALSIGSLLPIPTEYEFIQDSGIRFFVRILSSLSLKDEERKKQEHESSSESQLNPFLPYDEKLFVADVTETHVAVLNKFNVVERHLLIITREFEHQEILLTVRDFEALWACLAEYNGLGFYNGGVVAGASQPHKHLQVVPLPLAPEGPQIPIEPLLDTARFQEGFGTIEGFPFLHIFTRLNVSSLKSLLDVAEETFTIYSEMLRRAGLRTPSRDRLERQSLPYCLLITNEWMLLVPRSQEFYEGISINSLGFAGALLVRNEQQMEIFKKHGPLTALKSTALARND